MNNKLKSFGLWNSLIVFGIAAVILVIETTYLIPYLVEITGIETIVFWLLVSALLLFSPMVLLSYFILKSEGFYFSREVWEKRLRFKKMDKDDWNWTIIGIMAIGLSSFLITKILLMIYGEINFHPPFMSFEPLTANRFWILVLWFPCWLFNIMGEEILWRGIILPRQEILFGKFSWLIHGFFWGIFHIGFGLQLLITLIPILFILPFIVQKRENSWIGVVVHGVVNGPAFIAIALGII